LRSRQRRDPNCHAKSAGYTARASVARGTRGYTAYFLGVTSAGRYREISKPAATWHIVGFVQLFFIRTSFYRSAGPILSKNQPLRGIECNGSSIISENGQMKQQVLKLENKRLKVCAVYLNAAAV